MKKIFTILLGLLYICLITGLVLQVHYCMGQLVGSRLTFSVSSTSTCHKCGMQHGKNKCCHNDIKIIKLQDVHHQSSLNYDCKIEATSVFLYDYINNIDIKHVNSKISLVHYHPPPLLTGQPLLHIRYGVFRI